MLELLELQFLVLLRVVLFATQPLQILLITMAASRCVGAEDACGILLSLLGMVDHIGMAARFSFFHVGALMIVLSKFLLKCFEILFFALAPRSIRFWSCKFWRRCA